jgi:hypothetical protein
MPWPWGKGTAGLQRVPADYQKSPAAFDLRKEVVSMNTQDF